MTAVQTTIFLTEAVALQRKLIPWQHAFDIPPLAIIGTPKLYVFLPDLFILLSSYFWSTTLLWLTTSILLPAGFAYFYNLSTRTVKRGGYTMNVARYTADPMVFNIVKALVSYVVYDQDHTFGLFGGDVSFRVKDAMFGGSGSMLVTSGIGILAALYEAAQVK